MTSPRDLDRLMEAFLEDGPSVMTDRVAEAIWGDVERTEQRAGIGLWRNPLMTRFAFAAAVVTAVLVGGLAIYAALNLRPDVGPPVVSPAPNSSPGEFGAVPSELQQLFLGPAKPIEGFDRIDRGDLSYLGSIFGFEIGDNQAAFYSIPSITAEGELSLRSVTPSGVCADGDVGTYPWSISPAGTVLTIEPGTDDCAMRAQVMPGTYERAACKPRNNGCLGELEAAEYASRFFEPRPQGEPAVRHAALTYAVPAGWANYADWSGGYGLTPAPQFDAFSGDDCYDCRSNHDTVTILGQPGAATPDCGEEGTVAGIGFARQDLVDWLTSHPGLVATDVQDWTVGGLAATSLIIEAAESWTGTCDPESPFEAVPLFFRPDDGGYHSALPVGTRFHVTLIDLGDGNTVAVVIDTEDDDNLEAFVEDALPIIETFEFPAR
jgi:hypothetical protein